MFEWILVAVDGPENAGMVFSYRVDWVSRVASTAIPVAVSESAVLPVGRPCRTYLDRAGCYCADRLPHYGVARL